MQRPAARPHDAVSSRRGHVVRQPAIDQLPGRALQRVPIAVSGFAWRMLTRELAVLSFGQDKPMRQLEMREMSTVASKRNGKEHE
jgi:hypothetical protein